MIKERISGALFVASLANLGFTSWMAHQEGHLWTVFASATSASSAVGILLTWFWADLVDRATKRRGEP